jgi:protein-arginine kinase activator protein McsA
MTEDKFLGDLMHCMKSSPSFARDIRGVLHDHMQSHADKENYEGACNFRDMIRFLDKRFLRGEKGGCTDHPDCASE